MIQVTYGPGGYDPSKPNSNVIGQVVVPDPEPDEADLLLLAVLS